MTTINSKNYVKEVLRTESTDFNIISKRFLSEDCIRLSHAAMGITTEAGEIVDTIKKHLFYGRDLDKRNLKEELGDLLWYIGIACDVLEVSLDELMSMNIEKLRKRYPEKFTEEAALNRDVDKELNHIK